MLIVLNLESVFCGVKNIERKVKAKHGTSSNGTYSYTSDHHAFEGTHVKSLKRLKNEEHLDSHDSHSRSNSKSLTSALFAPMLKTTVEYWPPDMDKEKFFSMKKDSGVQMWRQENKNDVTRVNQKVSPEKLPDIPIKTVSISINSWSNDDREKKIESLTSPTESSVVESVSVTDPGPVVFPTLEPTTKYPDQSIVFIARGGYKKRKLKKKAKTALPFVEFFPTESFSSNTESEIKASDINMPEATPIYEVNNEPVINIFPPVRYTDVVNNLSNLTEQSFGSSRVNDSNNQVEIISNSKPFDENNLVVNFNIGNESSKINVKEEFTTLSQEKSLSTQDIMPLEKLLNQLKQAIEDRDVGEIKRIVRLMEDPKVETIISAKISPPKVETVTKAQVKISSIVAKTESATTAPEKKIYLAPRIRIEQKMLKPNKSDSPDKLKDKSISISAETVTPTSKINKFMVTTEKIMLTSTAIAMVQARRPGRRGGRSSQESKQNKRVETTTTRERRILKNVTRRIVSKQH